MAETPTPEEVESELRDHSIILQQAAWNRSGTDQDYSISATLCEQAADTIASLRATLAERDAEIERLRAIQERTFCTACGTVSRDETCDCTRVDGTEHLRNAVNYADMLLEDCKRYAKDADKARATEREACAKVADDFTGSAHIAHDMRAGIFPKQSNANQAIAAAIRERKP